MKGFSLVELLVVIGIMVVGTAIAIPLMGSFVERSRQAETIATLLETELEIERYVSRNFELPDTLAEVGIQDLTDPWGFPIVYLRIEGGGNVMGQVRKDKNLNPINGDFDLYSPGPDGQSVSALTAATSRDDIVRAGNGSFFGVAEEF